MLANRDWFAEERGSKRDGMGELFVRMKVLVLGYIYACSQGLIMCSMAV